MHLFYTGEALNETYTLSEDESKHAIRVLRLTRGDIIALIDGLGGYYEAEISSDHPKRCEVNILRTIKNYNKRSGYLHLAVAPTKNIERFEWFLEKATEIGVDEITPLLTFHSERETIKLERLEKVLVSAIKQSMKAYLPKLNNPKTFDQVLKESLPEVKCIAHCYEGEKQPLHMLVNKTSSAIILVGPEGDFSKEEVEKAEQNKFKPVTLGTARLRTETAGVVACTIANL
jgi:16S rRNA (uracil1498-N3)-methyltransferase